MASDDLHGWIETAWQGGWGGPFRVWRSGLSPRSNYFCALVRRCASSRRAWRRSTNDPVLTSSERPRWLLPRGPPTDVRQLSGSAEISIRATTAPATGVQRPATRRSPDIARDAEASVRCNGGSLHRSRTRTPENDRADDQSHDQQTDARPTAGERGIEASQHVSSRLHYSVVAARGAAPHGVAGMTLSGR